MEKDQIKEVLDAEVAQNELPTGTYRVHYCPEYEDACARIREERQRRVTRRDIPSVRGVRP